MKKRVKIICFFIAIATLPVNAQQNFASISFGAAIPLGDYASIGDLATSGYARTGGTIKFDAGYFPGSYFGIGGSFSFGSNYAIRDSMFNDMFSYIEKNASSLLDIPNDAEIRYGSGFWNYINLFLGPHFSVRASQKLYLDFRGLAGVSFLRPPDQELSISFTDTEIYSQNSNNTVSFGFTGGAGLRYTLNSNISLKLGADFFQSRARYSYTFVLFKEIAEDVTPLETNFLVRTIELTAGLAYSF